MDSKNYITHNELIAKISYESETGNFFWNVNSGSRAKIGQKLGSYDMYGYLTVRINKKSYKLHRLAWFYVHKIWPENDVDHINGIRNDNRLCNLRCASRKTNLENRTCKSESETGLYGAYYDKRKRKYYSAISHHNIKIHLGMFESAQEAHNAYIDAKQKLHAGYIVTPEMV